jgi:Iron-containing redox enzyme
VNGSPGDSAGAAIRAAGAVGREMRLPAAVGPVGAAVNEMLAGTRMDIDVGRLIELVGQVESPLTDLDFQSALTCCYELHYRGFTDVDDALEWNPRFVAVQGLLEARFDSALRAIAEPPGRDMTRLPVDVGLRALIADAADGPSLSGFLLKHASRQQFQAFMIQRSLYHLKEADPHTWQIPRLSGAAKAALIAIQSDEYGNGRLAHMHSSLFAQAMRAMGLSDAYGFYWADALPETHASVNLMTFLGLHRQRRGALVGHLAALEMTSTEPNRRYANGLRRLGYEPAATAFFDEHVEADAVHEQLAAIDLCGSLVQAEPKLHADILWGARCCLAIDKAAGTALLRCWQEDVLEAVS